MALPAVPAWFVGLLPWLVRRTREGTFGTPWNPRNDLRDALLPFAQQLLPVLLVVTVVAGLLAGLVPWCSRDRRSRRLVLAALATAGALVAAGWSVAQTLDPDPDLGGSGSTADTVRLGFVSLTAAGALLGLVLGLTISLGGAAVRAVAVAPAAVLAADWCGLLVLAGSRAGGPSWLPTLLAALAGAAVGLGLVAAARTRVIVRVGAWVGSLILLVVTASTLTAVRYVLEALRGTPVRGDAVAELLVDGLRVLGASLQVTATAWGPLPAPPLLAVVVAVLVGTAGSLAMRHPTRTTPRNRAETAA